jgi:PAS domain S-box-containing protein
MIDRRQPAYEQILRSGALTISAAYLLASLIWILTSDALAFRITADPRMIQSISTLKGFGFVIVTAILLYIAIAYYATLLGKRDEEIRKNYDALMKSAAARKKSEERYRRLYESIRDAFVGVDLDGRFREWNPAFQALVGFSDEELRSLRYQDLTPEKWRSEESGIIEEQVLKRGFSNVYEKEYQRKDGTVFPVELRAYLLRDDAGEPEGMWAIVRDISERRQAEHALKLVNQKLQLMNMVAWHDIQNKITSLRGYVELSKDLITDEKAAGFLTAEEEILRVIHRQIAATQEYQEIGSRPLRWIRIADVMLNVRELAGSDTIRFAVAVEGLEIYGDPILEKVLRHLVDNSIRHGPVSVISLAYRESPTGIILTYDDNGPGIPPEKKAGLFTKSFGKTTGFGLFFVNDALEISGMSITENGEPGKGARFEIAVPKGMYRISG